MGLIISEADAGYISVRDAERDHVGQRIELAAERRRRLAPAHDAAVEHVEKTRAATIAALAA